jgi:hypothetical protein
VRHAERTRLADRVADLPLGNVGRRAARLADGAVLADELSPAWRGGDDPVTLEIAVDARDRVRV